MVGTGHSHVQSDLAPRMPVFDVINLGNGALLRADWRLDSEHSVSQSASSQNQSKDPRPRDWTSVSRNCGTHGLKKSCRVQRVLAHPATHAAGQCRLPGRRPSRPPQNPYLTAVYSRAKHSRSSNRARLNRTWNPHSSDRSCIRPSATTALVLHLVQSWATDAGNPESAVCAALTALRVS